MRGRSWHFTHLGFFDPEIEYGACCCFPPQFNLISSPCFHRCLSFPPFIFHRSIPLSRRSPEFLGSPRVWNLTFLASKIPLTKVSPRCTPYPWCVSPPSFSIQTPWTTDHLLPTTCGYSGILVDYGPLWSSGPLWLSTTHSLGIMSQMDTEHKANLELCRLNLRSRKTRSPHAVQCDTNSPGSHSKGHTTDRPRASDLDRVKATCICRASPAAALFIKHVFLPPRNLSRPPSSSPESPPSFQASLPK